jgi:hypothetical protein
LTIIHALHSCINNIPYALLITPISLWKLHLRGLKKIKKLFVQAYLLYRQKEIVQQNKYKYGQNKWSKNQLS